MDAKPRKILKLSGFTLLPLFVFITSFLLWAHAYSGRVLSGFTAVKAASAFDQTTFLYDRYGNIVAGIHGEVNRTPVPLEKVPAHVQKAFVGIEDERFYSHHGVDLKAVLRAAVSYCKSGEITEGGSTITQQTMKLFFLTPERTLLRKVKEAVLALEFEERHSKEEILELYLNRVYFGEGAYGIQSAAKTYFSKDSSELSIEEGALLAALVQAPSAYDPYINPEASLNRRNIVLDKMIRLGYITEEQGMEARNKPLNLKGGESGENHGSYFIDHVIDEAIAAVGQEKLFKGGLKIHTTLEPEIQRKAEKVFRNPGLFPDEKVEAALALVENGTGAIKALVGGREYVTRRGFNRATQLARQPGSAFKPVAVYAPAFELGYSPDSIISDTPFKAGSYEPENPGGDYYGNISIRTAVKWSRNAAAVRLLSRIGIDHGFEMAKKLGFDLAEEDRCLPLALGGLTRGVSPLQMAGAFAVFANGGVFIKPYAIDHIEDAYGEVVYRRPEGVSVMKPSTAEKMKSVLRAVVDSGTGYRASIRGAEVAGKTGTVELPDTDTFRGLNGNKDAWFVGFTPRYTAAVWMGYDEKDMDRQHYLTSYGGNQPAEIFRLVMAGVMGLDAALYTRNDSRTREEEKRDDDAEKQKPNENREPVKKQEPAEKQESNEPKDKDARQEEKPAPARPENPKGLELAPVEKEPDKQQNKTSLIP
ncbi:MAG TPA: PBP1A family penicillin-binding protein [Bacillota bacterium]|nr:PBP1A family penicillin-binding protein [Bacillota bacterium]